MKTYTLITFLALTNLGLASNYEDTVRFNMGGTQIIIIEDEGDSTNQKSSMTTKDSTIYFDDEKESDLSRWNGFYIGINGVTTPDRSFSLPSSQSYFDLDYSKSLNFNLNLIEKRFALGTPHVGISTGVGFDFNRYEFKRNVRLNYNSDSIWSSMPDSASGINYSKNFLKATYLQVPLILDFVTSKKDEKGFYFGVGVIGGYKIGSKMKVKYETDGDKHKENTKGDFNLNPFKLSATARMGVGNYVLFANYSLTSLFEKNRGPEVYPFSIGISLIPF